MKRPEKRISRITVRGFKSICTEQHIDIKPLTILAGKNSAGKSSFMQPLLLLKQTLEASGDPGALRLDGPHVCFTSAEQMLSRISGKDPAQDFSVRLDLLGGNWLELVFKRGGSFGFEIQQMVYGSGDQQTTITPHMSHEDIVRILPPGWESLPAQIVRRGEKLRWTVFRDRCFLSVGLAGPEGPPRGSEPYLSPAGVFPWYIQGVIHLPALRGNPRRTYSKASGGPHFQGPFDTYVASVIAQWESQGSIKMTALAETLRAMGLTWRVTAKQIDDTQVELKVARLVRGKLRGPIDLVSIADVGFGVSQSLPVIVALLAAAPGQLVYLEQPEIHLHPLAQRRLANVLKEAVERGVPTVVETHSALLLREVQTLVAKGLLSKDDVGLYWLKRAGDGSTTVTAADLDDRGAYGDWPEDFDQIEMDAEKAYLDAVEARALPK